MAELPVGTVTFLFTDIEGSTRLWQEQPEEMRPALARHDEILRDAIEALGGSYVKTTGDGAHAAAAIALADDPRCVPLPLAQRRPHDGVPCHRGTGPARGRLRRSERGARPHRAVHPRLLRPGRPVDRVGPDDGVGGAVGRAGRDEPAAVLQGCVDTFVAMPGPSYDALRAGLEARLGSDEFERRLREGARMEYSAAVRYALDQIEQLRAGT